MQYKTFSIYAKEVNYDNESRTISGYAAVFGNKDKAGDVLIKGCFSKSIQDRGPESSANDKIIMLWMHNMNEPIGRITVLNEDEKGLYFEAIIDEVPRGEQAIKQLESGTLNQFSIGYQYVWENCEYDAEKDAFIVKEVKLYEMPRPLLDRRGGTPSGVTERFISYFFYIAVARRPSSPEKRGGSGPQRRNRSARPRCRCSALSFPESSVPPRCGGR